MNIGTFYSALMNVAASKSGGVVSNNRLGRWLKRVRRENRQQLKGSYRKEAGMVIRVGPSADAGH